MENTPSAKLPRLDFSDGLLTPAQLAERWSMSPQSLANMRSQGRGPAFIKFGEGKSARVRYRQSVVLAYETDPAKVAA